MATPRVHLRILSGERRAAERQAGAKPLSVAARFDDGTTHSASLTTSSPGTLLLAIDGKQPAPDARLTALLVSDFSTIECGKEWSLLDRTRAISEAIYIIRHRDQEKLRQFEGLVAPEVFFYSSHYRLFDLETDKDAEGVSQILTALKDCPIPIEASVRFDENSIPVTLDFSSNSSDLSQLDLKIDPDDGPFFPLGEVILDFNFLSVRYLIPAKVGPHDKDFGFASAELGSCVLSVSGRSHDRYTCDQPVTVGSKRSDQIHCTLTEISPEGGTFNSTVTLPASISVDRCYIESDSSRVAIQVFQIQKLGGGVSRARFRFERKAGTFDARVSGFFFKSLSGRSVARDERNYEQLLDLYHATGCVPAGTQTREIWEDNSKRAWRSLDKELYGNCVLYKGRDGAAHFSIGALPLSRGTIYAHSLAGLISLEAGVGLSEQMVLTQTWLAFVPGAQYYSGSYRKTSKLSSRIHVNFSYGLEPKAQIILHTLTLWNPEVIPQKKSEFVFEFTDTWPDNVTSLRPDCGGAIGCLVGSPGLSAPGHNIRYVLCSRKNGEGMVGAAIVHHFPDLSTCTNFLNHSFLITSVSDVEAVEINSALLGFLRESDRATCPARASILLGVGPIDREFEAIASPPGQEYKPVFWTFTPQEELNCINISLAKASYNLCRKYGNAGLEAYAQTSLFS